MTKRQRKKAAKRRQGIPQSKISKAKIHSLIDPAYVDPTRIKKPAAVPMPKPTRNTGALSVKEFLKLSPQEIGTMTAKERRAQYTAARRAALKRLESLEEHGYSYRDIYRDYRESFAEMPSTMTDEEIDSALMEIRQFLRSPESTVQGTRDAIRTAQEQLRGIMDSAKPYAGIINPEDDNQLSVWGDFMDTIRALSHYELYYKPEDLNELWESYQQNIGDKGFGNAEGAKKFMKAFEKFATKDSVKMSDAYTETNKESHFKRMAKINFDRALEHIERTKKS
jgi:hypothetical protein